MVFNVFPAKAKPTFHQSIDDVLPCDLTFTADALHYAIEQEQEIMKKRSYVPIGAE